MSPPFRVLRLRSILCSSTSDVLEDCRQLGQCRRSRLLGNGCVGIPSSTWDVISPAEFQSSRAFWSRYMSLEEDQRCHPSDLICHLGDNPGNTGGWCTWSNHSGQLPTIRRTGGLYLSFAAGRHLILKELYLAMGYPCFPFAAQKAGALFRVFTESVSHSSMRKALGNSFHAAQMGVWMAALLSCVKMKPCSNPIWTALTWRIKKMLLCAASEFCSMAGG